MKLNTLINRHAKGQPSRALRSAMAGGLFAAAVVGVVNLATVSRPQTGRWIPGALFLFVLGSMWVSRRMAARRLVSLFEDAQRGLRDEFAERLRSTSLRAVENLGDRLERTAGNLAFLSTSLDAWVSGIQSLTFIACITLLFALLSLKALVLWVVTLGAMAGWTIPRALRLSSELESLGQNSGALGQQVAHLVDSIKQAKLDEQIATSLLADFDAVTKELYGRQYRVELLGNQAFVGANSILVLLGMGIAAFAPADSIGFDPFDAYQLLTLFEVSCVPLLTLLTALPQLARAESAAKSILDVLDGLPSEPEAGAPNPGDPNAFKSLGLCGAEFVYPSTAQTPGFVVGPVDLTIRRGELVLITGGNGSGKTTLLKMLLGLYPTRVPAFQVDGRPVGSGELASWRARFSAILTEQYLFDRLYGLEDIPTPEVTALMGRLGIAHTTRYDGTVFTRLALSTGQRMRLAMVVALLEDRPVYLFDEWSGNQDPEMTQWYYDTLLPELLAAGKTIIAVSHDDRYFARADHLVRLDRGKVGVERRKADVETP